VEIPLKFRVFLSIAENVDGSKISGNPVEISGFLEHR